MENISDIKKSAKEENFMIFNSNLYRIYYNDNDKTYISNLIETIDNNLERIMVFFELENFSDKKTIKIWHDLVEYRFHLEPYVSEYQDWMVADTFDNNINVLSFNLFLSGPHRNSTFTDYCKIIIHEFVHACQQEINPVADNIEWFWEALATNLANQDMDMVHILCSKEDIIYNFHKLPDAYSVAFTIGKYMLQKWPSTRILEYIKNPNTLIDDIDYILEITRSCEK